MTIELEHTTTMDISKKNNTYNIRLGKPFEDIKIAASNWLLKSTDYFEARCEALKIISNIISLKTSDLQLWLLVGDSGWQNDTRIIRYKKLLKRLKSRIAEIEFPVGTPEKLLEHEGKIKFFAAVSFNQFSIDSIVKVLEEEKCSYIVAIPDNVEVNSLLVNGWHINNGIDLNILKSVVEKNGLLFKLIGEFDDQQTGFVGFGTPWLIQKIEAN